MNKLLLVLILLFVTYNPEVYADYKVRVFSKTDGSVVVVHPADKNKLPGETDEQLYERIMERTVQYNPELNGLDYVDMMLSELPADRSKRYSWRKKSGKIEVDNTVNKPAEKSK